MGIEIVSLMIAAFASGALGVAALLRNLQSRRCLSFAVLCLLSLAHDVLAILEAFGSARGMTPLRVHLFLVLAMGPAALWFISNVTPHFRQSMLRAAWLMLALAFGVVVTTYFPSFSFWQYYVVSLSHALFVFPAGIVVYALQKGAERATLSRERIRLRYAFWGAAITITLFLTDAFYRIGIENIPPLGTLARTLYLLFVFQIFVQKEFITAEEVVARLALFGCVALTLSVIYALMVSWVGNERGMFFFNTLIASLVVIILFDPIRGVTTRITRKLFLRLSSLLETELDALSADLMGIVEPTALNRRIRTALKRSLGVETAALYCLERDGLSFVRVEATQDPKVDELSASNPLVEYMTLRRGRPFVLETIENDRDSFYSAQPRRFCQSCIEILRQTASDFIIPFYTDSKVVGFCAVQTGEKVLLTNEQLRLFVPVSRQIALLLKNAQAFTVLKDRDKLAAVGEMAVGLAHEIKNPLGAIRGAAELLRSEGKSESATEITKIILDETDRLSGVLSDFLDYARPRRNHPQTTCDPLKVIEHTAALVLRDSRVKFELVTEARSAIELEADPDVLKQVLLNLFINALHAIEGKGDLGLLKVRVKEIRPRRFFPFGDSLPFYKTIEGWQPPVAAPGAAYVEIAIEDNGVGIDQKDMSRIFVPFFTTKPNGSGLGLAISQRLVENLGGTINVRPNYPAGTVFTIHIPLRQEKEFEPATARAKVPSPEKEIFQ